MSAPVGLEYSATYRHAGLSVAEGTDTCFLVLDENHKTAGGDRKQGAEYETGDDRILFYKEPPVLYCLPDIMRAIRSSSGACRASGMYGGQQRCIQEFGG
jgi:hypothetical protein